MSNDTYHTEIYTHKSGKKYHVELTYDYDMGPPQEEGDGYGVTERMDWNPTDEEQLEQHINDYEPELEEETRLRMMRRLQPPSNWADSGLYYDVLSSLHKAREDGWGARAEWKAANPTATKEEELMYVVNKDFKHLKGWYDNDWHWVTVSVAPLDEDGEPMEDHREYCGGYGSTIVTDHENIAYKQEAVDDLIHSVEYSLKQALHKDQMELALA